MQPIRVFIVEDDPMVLMVNRRFTERVGGFQVAGSARTAAQARQAIQRLKPSLILLDVYLPDQSGISLLKEIRQLGLDADVILISAAHDSQTVQEALRHGACDYLIKPFTFERFQQALSHFLLRRARLGAGQHLDQEAFDGLMRTHGLVPEEPPPKGIDATTLQFFLRELEKADGPLSAVELAGRLGVSRITAVRYLRYLVQCRQVVAQPVYGTVGRPLKKYRLSPARDTGA